MALSIGILIIGSLYWDTENYRSRWRNQRINRSAQKKVKAPIRYGRRSQTRGDSYTMVISDGPGLEMASYGTAFFVPCRRNTYTIDDIVEEAEFLWSAETNSSTPNGRISANWGCVALALNSACPTRRELGDGWAARVASEQHSDRAKDERSAVTASGLLNISWPEHDDGTPLEADALLATVTRPTLVHGDFPSAKLIAGAWMTEAGRNHVDYFHRNREHKIITFQDEQISQHLGKLALV